MKEREFIIVSGLLALLLILWLGFSVHESPRFAGTLVGGALAVSGSALMLLPFAYLIIKRVKPLKRWVTKRISMRTLLAWHIYAGVLGPILVLLHTGHKFESPLGIALTAMTLIVVVSGFVGRYLMKPIGNEVKEKTAQLRQLQASYDDTLQELRSSCADQVQAIRPFVGMVSRLFAGFVFRRSGDERDANNVSRRAIALTDAIADLEFAIRTHETFKKAFGRWLKLHIALSCVLYVLLALHVWAAIYFGLRWFG